MSADYSIREFLPNLYDLSPGEAVARIEAEAASVRPVADRTPPREEVHLRASWYLRTLSELAFFVQSATKPPHMDDFEFTMFRPLAKRWVNNGTWPPGVLDAFRI